MFQRLLPFVILFGIAATPAPCQESPAFRVYDLRFLTAPEVTPMLPHRSTPNESADSIRTGSDMEHESPPVDAEWLLRLLEQEVGAGHADEPDGPRLQMQNGMLFATADGSVHGRLAAVVEQFRAWSTEEVAIEVHGLRADAMVGARAVLTKAEANRLLDGAGPHPTLFGRARVGRTLALQGDQHEAYVRDYDTEVAQGANIVDPKVDLYVLGNGWRVALERASGGRLLVAVEGEQSHKDADTVVHPIRSRDVRNLEETSLVQLPRLRVQHQRTRVALADGEALVVGSGAPGATIWCIRVRRGAAAASPAGEHWRTFPVASLCSARSGPRRYRRPGLVAPGDDRPVLEDLPLADDAARLVGETRLEQTLREVLRGEAMRAIELQRDLLVARAPQADLAAVGARIEQLDAEAMRQVTIEARYGSVDMATANALLQSATDVGDHAGRLENVVRTAALLDTWFDLRAGRELSFIRDYEVEIAQESTVANPVIDMVFAGVAVTGHVLPVTAGRYRLDLEFGFAQLDGDIESFDTKHPRLGNIDLPRVRSAWFRETPVVDNDRWTLLHVAPVPGTDQHFVVMVRVRE